MCPHINSSKSDDLLVQSLLQAQIVDEPLDQEARGDLEETEKAIMDGRVKPWEEVKKEIGL